MSARADLSCLYHVQVFVGGHTAGFLSSTVICLLLLLNIFTHLSLSYAHLSSAWYPSLHGEVVSLRIYATTPKLSQVLRKKTSMDSWILCMIVVWIAQSCRGHLD